MIQMIFFLAFDLSDKKSFEDLDLWIKEVNDANIDDKINIKMLIGNKFDSLDKIISENEAKKFAEENGMKYLSVSTNDGINIIIMFEMIGYTRAKAIQVEEYNAIKDDNNKSDKNTQSKNISLNKKKRKKIQIVIQNAANKFLLKYLILYYINFIDLFFISRRISILLLLLNFCNK